MTTANHNKEKRDIAMNQTVSKPILMMIYKMKKRIFILVSLFSFAFSLVSSAQRTIKTEEVDVVKAYHPLLADADKIQSQASPADIDTSMETLKYDVKQHVIPLPFTPAEIKPLALPEKAGAHTKQFSNGNNNSRRFQRIWAT
jgi:hypothetical protein